MPIKIAMYEKSFDYIGQRLAALTLDLRLTTIGKDGTLLEAGRTLAAHDAAFDYVWLSTHIHADGARDKIFGVLENCRSIGVLQTFNAGLDHPFYKKLSQKGTRICNSSAQGIAIAEYVMAQVLAVLHPIDRQRELQARKQWQPTSFRELSQTHWLIVGFGPIGQELAKRVKAFGAEISVIRRTPAVSDLASRVGTMADLVTYLADADVVVLACALNDATRGMADAAFFVAVKDGATLVNVGRGALMDDDAMIAALDKGRVGTAVLDVFHQEPLPGDNRLWSHPKVRVTAHSSAFGSGGRGRWDRLFLDNIGRFARGETLLGEVDPGDIG